MKTFDIQPRVNGRVRIGSTKGEIEIVAGRMAEKGNGDEIAFDGSDNFVVLEVGKRGSGKSYGMGSLLEGFATGNGSAITRCASHDRRAVVLLDPLDIHWTAIIPLSEQGPEGLRRQWETHRRWGGLAVEPINVQVFVPAGYAQAHDLPAFREYQLPVSSLDAADWGLLLETNLITEPRGRLLDEAYRKVTELGWDRNGAPVAAKRDYGIQDIVQCVEDDADIRSFYAAETCRSVLQPLRALARMPLFTSPQGTPLTDVARPGCLSVLSLGRLAPDLRVVLTTVFVRKLKADRMAASDIRRRLALSPEEPTVRADLERQLAVRAPRTVLAIDEAQILMPAHSSSTARRELDAYVLEGRNFGLSLWLATQRPKGAVSDAASSQIDTFIVHRLSVADDIRAVCGLLQNAQPEEIRLPGGRTVELAELIRSLETGQAIFSSATGTAPRLVVGMIRPRNVAHGGEAF
jgi:hypothetical protein